MGDLIRAALDFGFSHAALLDPTTLHVREEVRLMCAANLCQAFERCWTCPPACGTLDHNRETITHYRRGLIVQTTTPLDDPFDYETMTKAGDEHKRRLAAFRVQLRSVYPHLIALGNGACTICETCTYPASACRLPALAISSMEAFGLVVSDVCADNGLGYYYGPDTITYTGCYLLEREQAEAKG